MAELHKDAVAIIGVGFKGPGADNLQQLWDVLERGENHVIDLPKDRWNVEAYYDPDPQATGKYYVTKAGLLSNPFDFDNQFFDINEIESDQMDPQQKLVLECSYRAMEHAGITRNMVKCSKTGVYIGAMNCDYRGLHPVGYSYISSYTVTGISNSIIAARVSYAFDLRGPCMVMDTGCSSALIAIHTACHALRQGDCSMAICGGTNFIASPDIFVHLSKAQMVSPTGQCHAFSDLADGYTRGEGCGIVILKKLCDAQRDNDRILGIIQTGTNQDGREVTPISAPSRVQQTQLLEDMYRDFSLEQLDEVEYIEAHGTGTQAGDVAEANALGEYFKRRGSSKRRLIGSIKTNIGHLESAAGVAGLIKVLLMMEQDKFVPSLFSAPANKNIDFDKLQLVVASKVEGWVTENKVACVNSFGFGGSNCHAIIRSHHHIADDDHPVKNSEKKSCVVCFSAKNRFSLIGSLKDFANYTNIRSIYLHDVSYTSTCCRSHYKIRKSFVVESMNELVDKVESFLRKKDADNNFKDIRDLSLVFVFGGMGTSWAGMCKELLVNSPVVRDVIQEIDQLLRSHLPWSLIDRLLTDTDMTDPLFSPLAIFACQVGLAKLWLSLGVRPSCIVGQSVGEVAASYISGHLSLHDAVMVVYKRSLLLSKVAGGNMFIVRSMCVQQVKDVVSRYHGNANVSVEYSPLTCAVSSDSCLVATIKTELLQAAGKQGLQISLTDLNVPTAFHSHSVESIKFKLRDHLINISPRDAPEYPMVSTVTGSIVTGRLDSSYWGENLREPVRFYDAIRAAYKTNSHNVYIDLSPRPVLRAHMQDIFHDNEDVETVNSLKANCEWRQFLESLSVLYCRGVDVNWTCMRHHGHAVTPVPRYVFNTRKGFYKSESAHLALSGVNCLRLSHPYVYRVSDTECMVMVSQVTFPSVYEHKVTNMLIVPGAFYPEIGFALARFHQEMTAAAYSVSAQFEQPFRLSRDGATVMKVECERATLSDPEVYNVIIKHEGVTYASLQLKAMKSTFEMPRENIQYLKGKCKTKIQKEDIYHLLKQYGFTYGPKYSLLEGAQWSDNECLALIQVPDSLAEEIPGTTLHPSVIDCMIQASVILAEGSKSSQDLLPKAIEKLTCYRDMERKMYITATKKGTQGHLTYYDIKLTTLDGQIIAHMESLCHKIMSRKVDTVGSCYNCVWTKLDTIYPNQDGRRPKALFITDFIPPSTPPEILSCCFTFDSLNNSWEVFNGKLPALTSSLDFIIVLIMGSTIHDFDDGETVLEKTANMCLFLQQLYNCAISQRFQKPIFVCSQNSFSLESKENAPTLVNPIMTSSWGMFRCAVHEPIHEFVFALDLHIDSESLNLSFLASTAELINNDIELRTYPEFLVTQTHLYVNQIVKLDQNIEIPNYRYNHTDSHTNDIVLNNHPSTLDSTFCVYNTEVSSRKLLTNIEVKVNVASIPSKNLYNINLLYSESQSNPPCTSDDGFVMFSLESRGYGPVELNGNKHVDVVACYPVPLASKVEVPEKVTVETELMHEYMPGDVSRLTVLLSLCDKVKTNTVTILASVDTRHLAECCQVVLQTLNSSIKVNIEQIEHLNVEVLEPTVLSLVSVDKRIISALSHLWEKIKHFVTMYTLVEEIMTLMYVCFPLTSMDILDTRQLFSPHSLIATIPKVSEWVRSKKSESVLLLDCLHERTLTCQKFDADNLDMRTLLQFQNYHFSCGVVRAGKSDLFRNDSVYLVVGGLTGLGWLTVKYLVKNGAGGIAILNRRSADRQRLTEITCLSQGSPCHIEVFSGDVTDIDSVRAVFESMCIKFNNKVLRGVFFSAGVIEDKLLLEMTRTDFLKVLSPKVKGAWNMHQMTKDMNLDYFVLYSSVTSVIGNIGQANYGAGNAFMDGLALYRRSMNLAGQSINWGALNVGMLEGNLEAKKNLESKGFVVMSEEVIMNYMQPMLLLNWSQIMPCTFVENMSEDSFLGVPGRLRRRMETFFRWFHKEEVLVKEDKLNMVRDLPSPQRLAVYEQYVSGLAIQVLSLHDGAIKSESNLADFGLDSIVAMTMITYIYRHTGCRLHLFQLLSGQAVVKDIALKIDEALTVNS
ncbi:hypothetical protein Btru_015701 [Bulinus truncatus]|nr:hypothetical protein Btru_015701 [Bulinus truncatus]